MRMRMKLLLSYLLVVLTPVSAIGYFLIYNITQVSVDNNIRINEISLRQIQANMQDELANMLKFADRVALDKYLMRYLDTEYNGLRATEEEFVQFQKDYNTIYDSYSSALTIMNNGTELVLFTDNDTLIKDRFFLLDLPGSPSEDGWVRSAIEGRGDTVLLGVEPLNRNNEYELALGRQFYESTNNNYTHLMRLSIAESTLHKYIERESGNKDIYLLDHSGRILTSNANRAYIGQRLNDIEGIDELMSGRETGYTVTELPLSLRSPFNGMKLVGIVSSGSVLHNISGIVRQSVIVCLLCVLVSVAMMIVFSERLSRRLKLLVKSMANIRENKFQVPELGHAKDEIGELSRSFRSMIGRIDELISEGYKKDIERQQLTIEKQDAELRALQSQINPHFLFNTMETIRMTLVKKRDTETADIVASFAKLIRQSLDWRDELIPVRKEVDFIRHYCRVCQFRFREKLVVDIDCNELSEDVLIPKFTIQPLVENAIIHGIENKSGGGTVRLTVSSVAGRTIIAVHDNGNGFSREKLNVIKGRFAGAAIFQESDRIGLLNVHFRLSSRYGPRSGLVIESAPGSTTVSFDIPSG